MSSLRTLLSSQAPLLLIDAASTRIQVGILSADPASWRWHCSDEESGTGIFSCLEALHFNPLAARGFIFCEGPGSILGIRSVASALRAWKLLSEAPSWSFRSLDLVFQSLHDPRAAVIADARRDSWHLVCHDQPMRRTPTAELPASTTLFTPAGFRQWSKLPPERPAQIASYDLASLLPPLLDCPDLFLPAEQPDAFLHEEPSYATWSPQIHRPPEQPSRSFRKASTS